MDYTIGYVKLLVRNIRLENQLPMKLSTSYWNIVISVRLLKNIVEILGNRNSQVLKWNPYYILQILIMPNISFGSYL